MDPEGTGTKASSYSKYFVFFGIFFLIITLLLLVPTKTIYEDVEVSYEETISYWELEPYSGEIPVYPPSLYDSIVRSSNGTVCFKDCYCDNYKMLIHQEGIVCTHCICPTSTPVTYRTVTMFRQVEKTRKVTQTRTEQRPVEVNWIFGYKTPNAFHLPALTLPFFDGSIGQTSCQYRPCDGQNCEPEKDARNFPYILHGTKGTIGIDLERQLYSYTNCRSGELGNRHVTATVKFGNTTVFEVGGVKDFYFKFMDDPWQKPALTNLSRIIRDTASNPDDQARIAVSLVQSVPYKEVDLNGPIKLPYEVLYTNSGDCDEKSILLASLLRDLGYNITLFRYEDWKHMAVGIKVPSGFDYKHTGYALIETTGSYMISFDSLKYKFGEEGNPVIIPISKGREFNSINEEYTDARNLEYLIASNKNNGKLSSDEMVQILGLKKKYGLNITVNSA